MPSPTIPRGDCERNDRVSPQNNRHSAFRGFSLPIQLSMERRLDQRSHLGPLEHEFALDRQLTPQWRDSIQTGNHAFDSSRILYSRHGRRPTWIRFLTPLSPPRDIAKRGEALRLRHFGCMARIVDAQRSLASLLLALLPRPFARVYVALGGGNECAPAECSRTVDSVREAELSLDEVMQKVVRDVLVVPGRGIHRASGLVRQGDDDRITPSASAPERNVHRTNLVFRDGASKRWAQVTRGARAHHRSDTRGGASAAR